MNKKDNKSSILSTVEGLLKEPKELKERGPRTLNLDTAGYLAFQQACRERGTSPSKVIDQWIKGFLMEIKKTP